MTPPKEGKRPLRVVVVDDSAICRAALKEILQRDGDIEVVGEAPDGKSALELIATLKPDLATIDIQMPRMAGFEAIEHIMALSPVPLLVVSARAKPGSDQLAFEAIGRGALDLTPKPVVFQADRAAAFRQRVRDLARVPVVRRMRRQTRPSPVPREPSARGDKPSRLRVLVVDDSAVCRAALRKMLEAEGDIEVVGEAADGRAAAELAGELRPDLTTMDIQMPGADGFEGIERIMAQSPAPVLVVTAQDVDPREALQLGALDVMNRPLALDRSEATALRDRVRRLARVPVVRHVSTARKAAQAAPPNVVRMKSLAAVGIAASSGGPAVVAELISQLGSGFPAPIAVVQHMSATFMEAFAQFLRSATDCRVLIVSEPVQAAPGTVLVASPDRHLVARDDGTFAADDGPPDRRFRPSGNVLFRSMARVFGSAAVGIVLTGLGDDGAAGLAAMKDAGSLTIAQSAESAAVDGMPRAARESGAAGFALDIGTMAELLSDLAVKASRGRRS